MLLDVPELLFPKVYHFDYIESLDSSVSSIVIPNWACNDTNYTIFDFSRFHVVESIEIGDNCFSSVKTFKIDGLNRLKSLKIGNKSFRLIKKVAVDELSSFKVITDIDKSKSFHILNCESLESLEIGEYSFNDFGGEFELRNLNSLQSIKIGEIGNKSSNMNSSILIFESKS